MTRHYWLKYLEDKNFQDNYSRCVYRGQYMVNHPCGRKDCIYCASVTLEHLTDSIQNSAICYNYKYIVSVSPKPGFDAMTACKNYRKYLFQNHGLVRMWAFFENGTKGGKNHFHSIIFLDRFADLHYIEFRKQAMEVTGVGVAPAYWINNFNGVDSEFRYLFKYLFKNPCRVGKDLYYRWARKGCRSFEESQLLTFRKVTK